MVSINLPICLVLYPPRFSTCILNFFKFNNSNKFCILSVLIILSGIIRSYLSSAKGIKSKPRATAEEYMPRPTSAVSDKIAAPTAK